MSSFLPNVCDIWWYFKVSQCIWKIIKIQIYIKNLAIKWRKAYFNLQNELKHDKNSNFKCVFGITSKTKSTFFEKKNILPSSGSPSGTLHSIFFPKTKHCPAKVDFSKPETWVLITRSTTNDLHTVLYNIYTQASNQSHIQIKVLIRLLFFILLYGSIVMLNCRNYWMR